MLARLNDLPVKSPQVQQSRQEILLAIEAELEPNASLHWKQFLTLGIIDRTPMKIIRRLCIYFWLPMIREWTGSSLMANYASVILAGVGAKSSLVAVLSRVLTIFFAAGCVPLYFTIERVGGRAVLMYGAMAMSVLIIIFTILQAVSDGYSGVQWAALIRYVTLRRERKTTAKVIRMPQVMDELLGSSAEQGLLSSSLLD